FKRSVVRLLCEFSECGFKCFREFALQRLAGAVVVAIVRDAVNEKQAEDLDAAVPQLQLFLKMLLDGELDLGAPDIIPHAAGFFSKPQQAAIVEPDVLVTGLGIDLRNDEAI